MNETSKCLSVTRSGSCSYQQVSEEQMALVTADQPHLCRKVSYDWPTSGHVTQCSPLIGRQLVT